MDFEKDKITYQEYLSSSIPYSFTLQVLILKKWLFFSEELNEASVAIKVLMIGAVI